MSGIDLSTIRGSGDPAYPSMLPRSLIKEALASPSK
jgi:hypothetical protein